jgi:hypothetical protein
MRKGFFHGLRFLSIRYAECPYMGRFLPFSAALHHRAVMLQCMRQESATCRHSSNSEVVI